MPNDSIRARIALGSVTRALISTLLAISVALLGILLAEGSHDNSASLQPEMTRTDKLLVPEIERQVGKRQALRAGRPLTKPEIHDALEARGVERLDGLGS